MRGAIFILFRIDQTHRLVKDPVPLEMRRLAYD